MKQLLLPALFLFGACNASSTGVSPGASPDAGAGAATVPCDPLAPPPTTLGTALGAGKDKNGTLYLADPRVFVSTGQTLYRQHVLGSGENGGGAEAEYTWSFESAGGDGSGARSLRLQIQGGKANAMEVGPDAPKCFIGDGCAGEALTLVEPGAVAGMPLVNLPGVVEFVGDVENGQVLVVTVPGDNEGTEGFRLFYGPASREVEGVITRFDQAGSGYPQITFTLGGTTYTMALGVVYPPDSGPLGEPGPGTLSVAGGATLGFTLRLPAPQSLAGFGFTCLAP